MKDYYNYKLCYVDSEEYSGEPITLYFTELDDVTRQWGDDWDDAPYEHNAGTPYESDYSQPEMGVENGRGIYPKIDIFKVIITGAYNVLTPRTNQTNSPYSVEDINKGIVPWLTITNGSDASTFIKAGATLKETLLALKQSREYIEFYAQVRDDNDIWKSIK